MTNSEKLLSSFSENYFYKELVYADLKFTPIGGTEIELADLIINLEDIILAIQLKERNEKDRTQDKNIEEKWLKKKCKKAKEQIKDTISYITSEKVSFINARGKKTIINPNAEVVPLVVFENDSISEYEHLLRNHTNDGLAVNCMSIYDFKLMCKQLLSPIEIIEYLKWREVFYKNNGPINLLITETNNGFVLSKPQKNENLVQQYLYEKYGENAIYEDRLYYELFGHVEDVFIILRTSFEGYIASRYIDEEYNTDILNDFIFIPQLIAARKIIYQNGKAVERGTQEIIEYIQRNPSDMKLGRDKRYFYDFYAFLCNYAHCNFSIINEFIDDGQFSCDKSDNIYMAKVMTLFVYIKLFESIVTVEGEDFLNSREEKECYKLVRESTKFIYDRLEEFSKYNCKTASDELNRHMRNMFKNMRSSLKEEVGSIKKDFL